MTAKEHVLAIYPDAFVDNFPSRLYLWTVSVINSDGGWWIGIDSTPEKAWKFAWEQIQKNMLWKLEQ